MKSEKEFDEIEPLSVDGDDMKELDDTEIEETEDEDTDPAAEDVDVMDEQNTERPRQQKIF